MPKEGYIPTEEEKAKAEKALTHSQRFQSERRARGLDKKEEVPPVTFADKIIEIYIPGTSYEEQVQNIIDGLKKAKLYRKDALYRGSNLGELEKYKDSKTRIFASTEKHMFDLSGTSENAYAKYAVRQFEAILIVFDGRKFEQDLEDANDYSYHLKPKQTYEDAIIAIVKLH
jgi:hypothetical protein